jgi:hypothetical protein
MNHLRKTKSLLGCQWLMPVILATWEAEIRSITFRGHHGQKSAQDPISTNSWAQSCIIPSFTGAEVGRVVVPG